MSDFAYLTARDLVAAYRRRDLSPVEVVTATLDRAEALQPRLNAFITICRDQALAAARFAEAASEPLGPLHGVPFSAKDLIPTAGVRTTWGSKVFADDVPETDAIAVARMKAAGAILIGKTTTPEFGHGPLTEAPLFGRTANAWHAERTCGGSSGGGAASVAAGIGPLALTTDGGGSTRIPAACNGVVGLKQTRGLVPDGQIRDAFNSTALTGPTTCTVADNALMLSVLAGPHPLDPNSYGRALRDVVAAVENPGDLSGVRVAWRPTMGNRIVDAEVLAGTAAAARRFTDFGATVATMADDLTDEHGDWLLASNAHWHSTFAHLLADHRDAMTPAVVAAIESVHGHGRRRVATRQRFPHHPVSPDPRLVHRFRPDPVADAHPHRDPDRRQVHRPAGDRRRIRRAAAPILVPLHLPVQPLRPPGDHHPRRLRRRRLALRAADHRPVDAATTWSCAPPPCSNKPSPGPTAARTCRQLGESRGSFYHCPKPTKCPVKNRINSIGWLFAKRCICFRLPQVLDGMGIFSKRVTERICNKV